MKNPIKYLLSLFGLLMLVFLIGKIAFVIYNASIEAVSIDEMVKIWIYGLLLDLRTSAIALLVPTLCILCMKKGLHYILVPYFFILGFLVAAIIVSDMVMYEFWEFKICAVHLSYAASPEGTTNSVSISFLLTRVLSALIFIALVTVPSIWMTPWRFEGKKPYLPLIILLIISAMPIHVGSCYHRGTLFHSHAATNPVYRFVVSFNDARSFSSIGKEEQPFPPTADDIAYNTTKGMSLADNIRRAYSTSKDITDTLLTTTRPNVLFVMLESFGGKFVKELGGIPDVAPNQSRLIPEGIFWDQYYSNSFRTDRGTVCTHSGWISYPTVSPMKEVSIHGQLSSLPRTFRQTGYQTGYLYGGAMTNMGKYQYLSDMGFETLMDETYFTAEELNSSWGANDSIAAMKLYHTLAEVKPDANWMMVWQTISSHEPWDVPYHRLEDEKLNAFAYTDQCLGDLVDSLRTLPVWDNLLVIVIPDHGYLYQQTYDNSEFFHSPMLWLGGAVKEPRRISILMNQSDIAATLLAQMQLSYDDYLWSRNVFSSDYQPFIFCNYPAGLFYKDETGETLYDLTAQKAIPIGEPVDSARLKKALGILRCSYNELKYD